MLPAEEGQVQLHSSTVPIVIVIMILSEDEKSLSGPTLTVLLEQSVWAVMRGMGILLRWAGRSGSAPSGSTWTDMTSS